METKRVLVVDDDEESRRAVLEALERMKLIADVAVSGKEALASLEEKEYDMVFLDLDMPGIDGRDVLRRVREDRPDIPVVMIADHGTIESAVETMKLGAVDFMEKPVKPKEIRQVASKFLDEKVAEKKKSDDYSDHVRLARESIGKGNFDAAAEHAREAIDQDSSKPEGFNLLGAALEMTGQLQEALNNYRAAVALDSSYRPAVRNLERATGASHEDKHIVLDEEEGA